MELIWSAHRWLYQTSGGRLGSRIPGMLPVLLLTTTGRKSGLPRAHPLHYFALPSGYVVIASNAGEPRHPAWYHNLKAHPEATVQAGRHQETIRARETVGEERERLWSRVVGEDPSYAKYQERTHRLIPVLVLETQRPPGASG